MAIKRPDRYEHENESLAIVDGANITRSYKEVATIQQRNDIPLDKRGSLVEVKGQGLFRYLHSSFVDAEWIKTSNWEKVGDVEIVDNLTTGGSNKPLSAEQGKVLEGKKLDKSTADPKSDFKFINENGNWIKPPNLSQRTAFVDPVNGDDTTAVFEDQNNPYKTAEAARLAIEAKLNGISDFNRQFHFYKISFLGNGQNIPVPKLPKCSVTLESLGSENVINFSSATEAIINASNAAYEITIDNVKGGVVFDKSFTGNATLNCKYVQLEINASYIRTKDIVQSATFFECEVLICNIKNAYVGSGSTFTVQNHNSLIPSNINIETVSYIPGGVDYKSLFYACQGKHNGVRLYLNINTINGIDGQLTLLSRTISYAEVSLSRLFNVNITNPTHNPISLNDVVFNWVNAQIINCYMIPNCINCIWSGFIRKISLKSGGKDFSYLQGSEGVSYVNLTIKLINWTDNNTTRSSVLIRSGYAGNKITLNNVVIEKSYITFATLFSTTQSEFDDNTHKPLDWYGNVSIKMLNSNPAFSQNNPAGTNITKINMFGNLYLGEGKYLPSPKFQVNSQESDSDSKYIEVTASRKLSDADKNKVLVVVAENVELTIPAKSISENFNCTITATTGNNFTIAEQTGVVVDAPSGKAFGANKTCSLGRLKTATTDKYILRP